MTMNTFEISDSTTLTQVVMTPHKKVTNGWNFGASGDSVGPQPHYVSTKFPCMNAPFRTCDPHKDSKSALRTLTVDFKDGDTNVELQQLRQLLDQVHEHISSLCAEKADGKPITVAPLIKPSKNMDYFDLISLRFWPGTPTFRDEATGQRVSEQGIDFQEYMVEPVVVLKDIWRRGDVFYPRFFLKSCTLIKKCDK